MKARQWFTFKNAAADPSVVEIFVLDIIGDWIDELINEYYGFKATLTAKGFIDQLAQIDAGVKTIRVHINSPGGDVFAALNIANALRDQQMTKGRAVETVIDGLAASAASIIAMAGRTVTMADNALMMIHNPWSVAMGSAADFRQAADVLDTIRNTLVATYQWQTKLTAEEIVALLDADTWMSAEEALAKGFATSVVAGLSAAASIDAKAAATLKVPEQFKARVAALLKPEPAPAQPPTPAAAAEVLAAVQAAGLDLPFASQLVAAALPMDQVTARIASAKAEKAAADARVLEIRAICKTAKHEDLADDLIAGGLSVEKARAHLTRLTAKFDAAVIDHTLPPEKHGPASSQKTLETTASIYARRNQQVKE